MKTIEIIIDKKIEKYKSDKTYKTVIKAITTKGYVILDRTGQEHTAKCCIPNIEFRTGQSVWIKEPMGRLRDIHICGIV